MMRIVMAVLMLLVLLSACAKTAERGSDLGKISHHFVESIRWKDFQGAARFLAADQREAFLQQFPRNKDLHMVDARIERVTVNEETGEVETVLFIEYYMLPSVTIKEWRWTQQWQQLSGKFPQEGFWLIQKAPPVFP